MRRLIIKNLKQQVRLLLDFCFIVPAASSRATYAKIGHDTEANYPFLLKPIDNIHQILRFLEPTMIVNNSNELLKVIKNEFDCDAN
ncbi:Uncharacterised protein [Legionella israelensis]|uniref:Uncharacterized protein n=1 Tax=Legionella israelensis TaxID=454 RepID=A0A0W0VK66_9GAMM|nr:hypothetical protein Lisr_1742 [Legionella israelensis]SCX86280.1 hypothetical protein SAMN02746069_00473 [Legionella israelensis DSM 19235]STX57802.1 Uncharacterised protein [Legionella israelensis]